MWTSSSTARTSLACLAASLLFAAHLGVALASEPTPEDLETARHLFNEANDLRDQGDLAGALERYIAADALAHTPITALEVGKAHLALGHLARAHAAFLSVAQIPIDPKESQNAKSARADAEALAKEVGPRVPYVTLRVENGGLSPMVIEIDGAARADVKLDTPFAIDPGKYVISVRLDDKTERRATVEARESEKQVVVLVFDAPKSLPPKAKPALALPEPIAPSNAAPPAGFDGTRFLVYGGFGVAAAGLVVGTVTGVLTLSRASTLRASCAGGRCPPELHDDRASVMRMGKLSNVAFIVAGCGALAGVVGLVAAPRSPEAPPSPGLSLVPALGPGFVGLHGSF